MLNRSPMEVWQQRVPSDLNMDRVSLKVLGPEYLSKTGSQKEAQEGEAKTSASAQTPKHCRRPLSESEPRSRPWAAHHRTRNTHSEESFQQTPLLLESRWSY